MVILGLDPGTATTGYGVISAKDKFSVEAESFGIISTSPKLPMPDRLLKIHKELKRLILKFKPNAVSIEEIFFNTNDKTAVTVSQARGVLLLTAKLLNVKIYEYTPLQVKCALAGYGRAEKNQVEFMVKKILRLADARLGSIRDDAYDALALALTHLYSYNERVKT
jgi:crossover junction endodeoxyribonuclease RuvC